MKKVIFAAFVLAAMPALAADEAKPLPQDSQLKMLKAERDIQQLQIQMTNLQNQYNEAMKTAQALQGEMENECSVAAKQANVDLTKFSCDVDKLTFVPKPVKSAAATPASAPAKPADAKPTAAAK